MILSIPASGSLRSSSLLSPTIIMWLQFSFLVIESLIIKVYDFCSFLKSIYMDNFRVVQAHLLRKSDRASELAEQFKLLNADPSSGEKTLRRKWIEKMKAVHPDTGGSKEDAQAVNKAYQDIKDYAPSKNRVPTKGKWTPDPSEFQVHPVPTWLGWLEEREATMTPELKEYLRQRILLSPNVLASYAIRAHYLGIINILDPKDRDLMNKIQHVVDVMPEFLAELDKAGLVPAGNPDARRRALEEISRNPRSVVRFSQSKLIQKGDKQVVPILVRHLQEFPDDIYDIFSSGIIPRDYPAFKKLVISLISNHKGFGRSAVQRGMVDPADRDVILAMLKNPYPKVHKFLANNPNFYNLIHKNEKIQRVLKKLGL